jgi:hypothetical protein
MAMRRLLCLLPSLAFLLFAADPWTPQDLIEPAALAARLPIKANGAMVIYTGFPVLFRAAHIPGSIYAGPGSKAEGINDLKRAVAGQPKDRAKSFSTAVAARSINALISGPPLPRCVNWATGTFTLFICPKTCIPTGPRTVIQLKRLPKSLPSSFFSWCR